jgi:membrane-bound lytic murein transglycosylase D
VAKRYRLTPTSVAEWNKVAASASFAKGQQVVLFLPSKGKLMARASGPGVKHARRAAGKPTRMAKR